MKNTSRRNFIRNTSLVTSGVLIAGRIAASKKNVRAEAISCAPESSFKVTATLSSVRSGNWTDAATWGGRVPANSDTAAISAGHTVKYDQVDSTVAGVSITAGGTLQFDPSKSTTLNLTGNAVVNGKLQMRPNNSSVIQTLRFTGINESNFSGGGMDPLASDIGLWVMSAGSLDLLGSSKKSWTRANGSINAGASSVSVQSASGWLPGDEIGIAPTDSPTSASIYLFEDRSVTSVSGSNVSLNSALSRAHSIVNNKWTAEVINLTRNVRIEGTASGKSHIFIRSSAPQSIRYVTMRYMGPRKNVGGDATKELILGRYGLHFHHSMDGSRGSLIEGCVMRDTDSHAFVPHVSHGIVFRSNITYNTAETAFWWDEGDSSHEIIYDDNIVANCRFVNRSLALDTGDPNTPNFAGAAFLMGMGDDCAATNNVVVGCDTGDTGTGGAYFWQANNEGIWIFNNNMAHNNRNGLLTWQNSSKKHVVDNTIIYNCATAIVHGAYANSYAYRGGAIYGCAIEIEASSSDTNRVRLENIEFDGAGLVPYCVTVKSSPIPASYPIFIRGCSFKGFTKSGVLDIAGNELKSIDLIQCSAAGTLVSIDPNATSQEVVRIQPGSGQATRLTKSGSSGIANFAPTVWGNGGGLKGEYFGSNNLTNKLFERIDTVLAFTEWSTGVHNKVTGNTYSIRWSGKIQAQYTETYTFQLQSGGAQRMWVDNKLIIDRWSDHYPEMVTASPVSLVAGNLYDVKIEYFNTDERSSMGLYWTCASMATQYVPQSQLFTPDGTSSPVTSPVAENQGPVANAGQDVTISLPTNSVTLNGGASTDSDGSVAAYKWTWVSGPSQYTLQSPSSSSTSLYSLVQGTYVFRLQVTDNKGATATDDVKITVNPATAADTSQGLSITASPNPTTSTFRINVRSQSNALITVTILDNAGNVKDVFPNLANNTSGYVGSNYSRGTYYAVAQQGSEKKTLVLTKM